MVQLGDSNVQRKAAQVVVQADQIATTTIKLTVFRDEWPGEWEAFGQAPLREVINKFPLFRLCKGNRCGGECGRYHAPVDIEMLTFGVGYGKRSRVIEAVKHMQMSFKH